MEITTNCDLTRLQHPNFQHVLALAEAHNVSVHVCDVCNEDQSWADPRKRLVHIAPPDTDETYATALHEIGHLADPKGSQPLPSGRRSKSPDVLLDEERAAWRWARQVAPEWTPKMEALAQAAFGSYVQAAAHGPAYFELLELIEQLGIPRQRRAA